MNFLTASRVRPLWRTLFQGNFQKLISNLIIMKHQKFIIFYTHWRTRQNFLVKNNIKLVELSRLAHPYDFHA